ncbi:hypothetical protein AB0H76_32085 [Nocardia sp. NPDC050712]|uniref:hypothetical protein n=1 Tax=Nocardia sp. NPDC050712 TaxID=3155518 RepID=UPI0034118A1C
MTIEHPIEDEVTQLARRVERARGRLAWQFDPALTEALSEDELHAERELAERIREQDRGQRWKEVQALSAAADRARLTTEAIEKADMRDLLVARKAIAAQRRESSPHARLASLYRHRAWSLRALAGVVGAGMLWSAVNVQHNIAPGGPSDPLFWFSYLLEGMISVCLIIIMIGTNKVSEWGVVDSRGQVALAELALLGLTVSLNTYPYLRGGEWYEVAVHAIAPVMIGVALLIHDAASARYGLAIARATEQVKEMPDPAERIRRQLPSMASYTRSAVARPVEEEPVPAVELEVLEEPAAELEAEPEVVEAEEVAEVAEVVEPPVRNVRRNGAPVANGAPVPNGVPAANGGPVAVEKRRAPVDSGKTVAVTKADQAVPAKVNGRPAAPAAAEKQLAPVDVETVPVAAEPPRPAARVSTPKPVVAVPSAPAVKPAPVQAAQPVPAKAAPVPPAPVKAAQPAPVKAAPAPVKAAPAQTTPVKTAVKSAPVKGRKAEAPAASEITVVADREAAGKAVAPEKTGTPEPDPLYDTGQFRVADILEQELAALRAERSKARTSKQRTATR